MFRISSNLILSESVPPFVRPKFHNTSGILPPVCHAPDRLFRHTVLISHRIEGYIRLIPVECYNLHIPTCLLSGFSVGFILPVLGVCVVNDGDALADRVDACWVQVGGSSPSEDELDLVATADTAFSRFNDGAGAVGALSGQLVGTYRVKLGTVKKDELVKQDYASDVYWSTVLLERT